MSICDWLPFLGRCRRSRAMGNKALLVGVNAYPSAPLRGCLNDIGMMRDFLMEKYGFDPESIRMLADSRATKKSIMERLEWLIDVPPGAMCLFHYSGHGAQVASKGDSGEVDGLDEVMCPVDFSWTPETTITDNELFEVFSRVPEGVKLNWVSDSCHSGTLTRDERHAPKFIPAPMDIAWGIKVARHKGIMSTRALRGGVLDVGFVSGCRSDQTSADTVENGKSCGALTYFLVKKIGRAHV